MLRDNVNADKEALCTPSIWLREGISAPEPSFVIDVTQFSRRKPLERSIVDLIEALSRSARPGRRQRFRKRNYSG